MPDLLRWIPDPIHHLIVENKFIVLTVIAVAIALLLVKPKG